MSDTVLIYGHSDDLIEVEGAINKEIAAYGDVTIRFNDGRKFKATYNGTWEITPLNMDKKLSPTDYSDLDVLLTEELPNVTNDYSQVAVYRAWNRLTDVEAIEQ